MQSANLLIFMKISLLLLTAFAAIPVYAGNLKYDDWSVNTDLGGGDYAVDEDGTLSLNNVALTYTPETLKMQDGSSLSITLSFETSSAVAGQFYFSPYATGTGIIPNDSAIAFTGSSGSSFVSMNILPESTSQPDIRYMGNFDLSLAPDESTIVLDFLVKNDDLYCTYTLNEQVIATWNANVKVDTESYWKPYLTASDMTIKVTEMSLIPASSPVVPEPTTATLSLLALAGLAARRRRASR